MADIQVIKLKVRRGLDAQRRLVMLDQGELGFTIDTKRLFIGTGTSSGGVAAAPKIHEPVSTSINVLSTSLNPEIGDIVRANNLLYQFNNSKTWQFIGTEVDDGTISYDNNNQLGVTLNSINASYLNQAQLSSSSVIFDSGALRVNYNTSQFTISSGSLSVAASGIKPVHIDPSVVSRGLVGGGGQPISASVDNISIGFNGLNQLAVIGTPISAVSYSKLGNGLDVVDNIVSTRLQNIDSNYFALSSGTITLNGAFSSVPLELATYQFNDAGLQRSIVSSIYDILSCNTSGILSSYNGSPDQVATGYAPSNGRTTIQDVLSCDIYGSITNLTLSSAGFIVFEGNSTGTGLSARNNNNHIPGRFAIPVFTF